jgi:hypothetical protein
MKEGWPFLAALFVFGAGFKFSEINLSRLTIHYFYNKHRR